MKKIADKIIQYRYIIALIAFVAGVSLELHGSSMTNWSQLGVRETVSDSQVNISNSSEEKVGIDAFWEGVTNWVNLPPKDDGTIIGQPRMIRTDEWLVQTPFYLSQARTGNRLVNSSYAFSGQNMLVAYNAPVWHISVLGKPFNWGFLFLGTAKGMAWYWCLKLIGLLLLGYEFSMILTKKNKYLSLIGSFWIAFIPTVQWWFMQHLGDVVFFSLLMMVSMYHFFWSERLSSKILFASLLSSAMIGFTLVIYPSFQVAFAYLVLLFFVIQFWSRIQRKKIEKIDWLIMATTLLTSVMIIGYSLWESKEALALTLNTIYPGSRISVGGDISLMQMSEFLYNFALPYIVPPFSNQVELSSAIHFTPLFALMLPFVFKKKDIKNNIFGLGLFIYIGLLATYSIVGIPAFLSKITLFSFVTGIRAWQALSVIGVFASLWFIAYIWETGIKLKWLPCVIALVSSILLLVPITQQTTGIYISRKWLLVLLLVFMLVFITILQKKKIGTILLGVCIVISGMTVNPLVKGVGAIENKALSAKIEALVRAHPNALWMTDNGRLYQYPQMFGARTVDGVRFYPDKELMNVLDPSGQFEEKWNRYAHIRYTLTTQETEMTNSAPDTLDIALNRQQIDRLGIEWIVTNRDLTALFGTKFEKVYGPDTDGNYIYHYTK